MRNCRIIKGRCSSVLSLAALFCVTLAGCGPEPQANVGSAGSAAVNLKITMPQNVAAVALPPKGLWATVQRWVWGNEAWAASVNEITALVVQVTGPGIASPIISPRVPVSGAIGGQEIPVTLDVPVGTDRVFTVSALSRDNKPIFQGKSDPLTLTTGQAATANVRLIDTTIRITTSALPDGTDDRPYTATLLAERGTGAVTWTIQDGVLPPGVTLNGSNGALSGTPTTVGVFPITVRATDASTLFDEERLSIRINPAPIPPRITTTTLPEGTVGAPYRATLVAVDGTGAVTWSRSAGALPAGLNLDSASGVITGTPTTEETANFTVRATDTIPLTGEKALSIKINPAPVPPTITTTTLPDGTTQARYSTQLSASGGTGAVTWSVRSGDLPDGLRLNSGIGAITGTPTANGTFSFTVRATDTIPLSSEKVLTITIKDAPKPPVITSTTLPGGRVGDAYNAQLTATSTNGAVQWSSQDFPSNFTLGATTGLITGTPTAAGTFAFTVRATDGQGLTDDQALSIQVSEQPKPPIITTTFLPSGAVGIPYNAKVEAIAGSGALTWSLSPPVGCSFHCDAPPGIKLNASTGEITGTPTTDNGGITNLYEVLVVVMNTAGLFDSRAFAIRISPPLITTTALPVVVEGRPYFELGGGKIFGIELFKETTDRPPYVWSILQGALPTGLDFSPNGTISGTPPCFSGGTDKITVQVKDGIGATDTKEFELRYLRCTSSPG